MKVYKTEQEAEQAAAESRFGLGPGESATVMANLDEYFGPEIGTPGGYRIRIDNREGFLRYYDQQRLDCVDRKRRPLSTDLTDQGKWQLEHGGDA